MGRLSLEVPKHNMVCQKLEDSLQQIENATMRKLPAEANHPRLHHKTNFNHGEKKKGKQNTCHISRMTTISTIVLMALMVSP